MNAILYDLRVEASGPVYMCVSGKYGDCWVPRVTLIEPHQSLSANHHISLHSPTTHTHIHTAVWETAALWSSTWENMTTSSSMSSRFVVWDLDYFTDSCNMTYLHENRIFSRRAPEHEILSHTALVWPNRCVWDNHDKTPGHKSRSD